MEDHTFTVSVFTPNRMMVETRAEALTCRGLDGEIGVMANHMPCVIALDYGLLKLKHGGEWTTYLCSEGFLEVYENRADLYVDFCREEEDLAKALAELERLRKRDYASVREHWKSEIRLTRIVGEIRRKK